MRILFMFIQTSMYLHGSIRFWINFRIKPCYHRYRRRLLFNNIFQVYVFKASIKFRMQSQKLKFRCQYWMILIWWKNWLFNVYVTINLWSCNTGATFIRNMLSPINMWRKFIISKPFHVRICFYVSNDDPIH